MKFFPKKKEQYWGSRLRKKMLYIKKILIVHIKYMYIHVRTCNLHMFFFFLHKIYLQAK